MTAPGLRCTARIAMLLLIGGCPERDVRLGGDDAPADASTDDASTGVPPAADAAPPEPCTAAGPAGGGLRTTTWSVGAGDASAHALLTLPDGRSVVAGTAIVAGDGSSFAIGRLWPEGTPDVSFGVDGVSITSNGGLPQVIRDLARQPDGKLIAFGRMNTGATSIFAHARYLVSGAIDTTFAGGIVGQGYSVADMDGYAVALHADGRVLMAGTYASLPASRILLGRLAADGYSFDEDFGDRGYLEIPYGKGTVDIHATGVAIRPVGDEERILVSAHLAGVKTGFVVGQLRSGGTFDEGFGGGGFGQLEPPDPGPVVSSDLAVDDTGRIVIGASWMWDGKQVLGAGRWLADGTPDSLFPDFDGVFLPGDAEARAVATDSEGRIVIAGRVTTAGVSKWVLVRLLADGAPDGTFGTDGVLMAETDDESTLEAIAIDCGGGIVAAGSTRMPGLPSAWLIVRYDP